MRIGADPIEMGEEEREIESKQWTLCLKIDFFLGVNDNERKINLVRVMEWLKMRREGWWKRGGSALAKKVWEEKARGIAKLVGFGGYDGCH